MKKYAEKNEYRGFSPYTFAAIKNRLATCSINSSFDEKTKGMHVSDEYRMMHNKLRRLYKTFITFRKSTETNNECQYKFVDYASNYFGIDKFSVIDFLNPQKTSSIDISNDEGATLDISDFFSSSESPSPENEVEICEKKSKIFSQINEKWKTQKKNSLPLMSELLTLMH